MRWLIAVAVLSSVVDARAEPAVEPRTIDFSGGFVYGAPFVDGGTSLPGVAVDLRWFRGGALWLGGGASFEVTADMANPERGNLITLAAAGIAAGVQRSLTSRLELLAGVRVEGVRASDWPMAREPVLGVRAGPQLSLAVVLGEAWGHPMSLEARGSWLSYALRDVHDVNGWQAGVFLVGVLFPDRPLRR
jgi:hypothetical protein